ncbi:MAG: efflux RND transporter periplasmic adaptor subunit [Flavobacteriaceae bacterium]
MKYIYTIIIGSLLVLSCGGSKEKTVDEVIATNNLEEIRLKRAEIITQQQTLNATIKSIDEKISELDKTKKLPLITTIKTTHEEFVHFLELQGNVNTKNLLTLRPEFSGILTNVYVTEGQKVIKGQLLAKIDDGGMSQQLAQLQIQATLAKTTFERQQRLWEQKIGSEIQYLQAKSSYEAQSEAVNQLKSQLAKTFIRAPFSGTIDDVITEQGSVVSAGMSELILLVNLDDMYIETDVPENYISSITKDKKVEVEFPILGKTIEAKVRQAGNYINPANRTFKVEIAVPNADKAIRPNLTAKLKINDYTSPSAILLPQSIISENAEGQQYVYIVANENKNKEAIAKKVIIETGKTQGDVIEVLNGLTVGDQIINEGARNVKDGQTVKIITL